MLTHRIAPVSTCTTFKAFKQIYIKLIVLSQSHAHNLLRKYLQINGDKNPIDLSFKASQLSFNLKVTQRLLVGKKKKRSFESSFETVLEDTLVVDGT